MLRATLLRSLHRTERGRRRFANRSWQRLTLETLEDRTAPAIFTVLNNADAGAGSLRQAILSANTAVGADTINFNIPGAGVHTISLLSALPAATGPLTIAGNTQDPLNVSATPLIELDGAAAGAAANGLILKAAGCVVRELVINGFQGNGLLVFGSNSVVEGCFVGTNAAGTASDANAGHGILVAGVATGVRIGGTTAAARNVISGNALYGVAIQGALVKNTRVQGNFIGTDVAGTVALGNALDGVLISGGSDANVIGGTVAGARNVISGNANGVSVSGVGTTGNVVQGNFIGTDFNGTAALGNTLDGVVISAGATNNTVGGTLTGARNIVSGNLVNGVSITGVGTTGNRVQGNFIGTDLNGTADLGNTVQGVLITAGAANNTVGGTLAGARNVISGNNATGVLISGAGTTGTVVQGNFIGTNAAGIADLGNTGIGVALDLAAVNNTIGGTVAGARNVISGNDQHGVVISGVGTTGNRVQGNFIGTDVTGTADLGNTGTGARIFAAAANNTIGGTVVGARNVLSGNNVGVEMIGGGTTGNRVQGNFMGTNAAGTAALGNVIGVSIASGASNNTIGGTVAGARNVISGNTSGGVTITTAGTTGNLVQGNFIGTNAAGTADLGNALDGIRIASGTTNTTVGGTVAGARNVISGNNRFGILIHNSGTAGNVVRGNVIGLAANGATALGNTNHGVFVVDLAANNSIGGTVAGAGNSIAHNGGDGVLVGSDPGIGFVAAAGSGNSVQSNRIFGNAGQGIDLGANDGPTANDVNDPDVGPNDLLNKPVLTSAFKSGTSLLLTGILNTLVNKVLRIEFFASPTGSQGQTFLGFLNLSTGGSNNVVFAHTLTVPASVLVGHQLTATMTDELGNTSEFSVPLTIE